MTQIYASTMLFTTEDGQVICNYIYIADGKLINLPVGDHALTDALEEQFNRPIYSPHHEVHAEIVPSERPEDYLKSLPYLYNGSYYRATSPKWIDIESVKQKIS
ncbi:hypothetical protein QTP81_07370 [Alteromonas sp. ASW11-36]|uniref:Uncharacterized protein n=1 Tax=Alteromonas arenosi TaxID=3055817 RepID=A0ABT7SW45_9ALTE|nr:hypothetical protein [Alteromonas sp. ASW11-36]MDM7860411.1 hypothetical protein [Alteromonas sp. ASW11-36]